MILYTAYAGKNYYPRGGASDLVGIYFSLDEAKAVCEAKDSVYVVLGTEPWTVTLDDLRTMTSDGTITVGSVMPGHPPYVDSSTWAHVVALNTETQALSRTTLLLEDEGDAKWHYDWSDWEPIQGA